MPTRTKAVQGPSAVELAREFSEEIQRAKLASGRVVAAIVQADAEIRAAQRAKENALDNVVRGEDDSDEVVSAATLRVAQAVQQRAGLDEEQASCMRVVRSAEERLRQLRVSCLPEFREEAEEAVVEVAAVAEELQEPLRRYLAAWDRAAALWQPLVPAVREHVEHEESARGFYRSGESIERDVRVPPCPVTSELVMRLGTVAARPAAMAPDYDGNPFRSAPLSSEEVDIGPELRDASGAPIIFDPPAH